MLATSVGRGLARWKKPPNVGTKRGVYAPSLSNQPQHRLSHGTSACRYGIDATDPLQFATFATNLTKLRDSCRSAI